MSRTKILLRAGYLFDYNGVLFKIEQDRFLPTLQEFNHTNPVILRTDPFEIINEKEEDEYTFQRTFGVFHLQDNCFYEKSITEQELETMLEKAMMR